MYAGRPIIGIAGGIGSGKSFIANCFGQLGCLVIDSDSEVKAAYADPDIVQTLREWWGGQAFRPDGTIDRRFIAQKVFSDPDERKRVEQLLHPWVNQARERRMAEASADKSVVAFVWDTPLLFETGLWVQCDALVFVDAPDDLRFERVRQTRGWELAELIIREKAQWPLDKKRKTSHYVLSNTADAAQARDQVRELLSLILAQVAE